MILEKLLVDPAELRTRTGWELKPDGLCRDDVCVPLAPLAQEAIPAELLSRRLGMPLVADEAAGIWALGPESGRVLVSAQAPDFTLPDWRGGEFTLSDMRGQKVLILAWAPW